MRELDIRTLMGDRHALASFHDADIYGLHIDMQARTMTWDCRIWVGDLDSTLEVEREATALGSLYFTGLLYFLVDPPQSLTFADGKFAIVSDGNSATTKFNAPLPALPTLSDPDAFAHWFFDTNHNATLYVAAAGADFVWDE